MTLDFFFYDCVKSEVATSVVEATEKDYLFSCTSTGQIVYSKTVTGH